MLNLKKTAVAVLALGSSVAFAGTMGPVCTPGNVTVPCESTAWDVGIQALYLKPAYNDNLGYVALTNVNGATTNDYNLVSTQPKWGWGFKLEASYHFSTGNDLNLNWYHLNDNSNSRTIGANTYVFAGFVDPDNALTTSAGTATLVPRWDAVNLEFGQHADFGQFKNIRFHGGVQYARIKTNTSAIGVNPADNTQGYSVASEKKYDGFGPRVGADMSYDLGNGVGMYANGAMALLAGNSKIDTVANLSGVDLTQNASLNGSRTAIVPELEAKLGLNYTYMMPQGNLTMDLGWMWVNYFNAQTSANLLGASDSDFGVQGPYLGLKWVGSVV